MAETVIGLGCVAVLRAEYAAAATLFAAADAALARLTIIFEPEYRPVYDRLRARLGAAVDPAALAAWTAAGAVMDDEQMIAAAQNIAP